MKSDTNLHEAGHACLVLAVGADLLGVSAVPNGEHGGHVDHRGHTDDRAGAMIALAGLEAERILYGLPISPDGTDVPEARAILVALGYGPDEVDAGLDAVRREVRGLLVARWSLVRAIAHDLDVYPRLTTSALGLFRELHDMNYTIEAS